ncbi:MAG TPA: flagellar biosynthesis protein FlhA [Burkholderiaceae bacterium]|jgi:flagellar biosynthesis protein FlhA|nr:flagellar biosynthesis protein FlhA [Burkholderiaceae bacterium]
MNALASIFDHPLLREVPWRSLAVPLLIFMVLAMMIVPMPPFLLDLLFTFNIALALVVLMAAAYTRRPLDFAAFPTVLLLTTLMRLSLNVASTRAVLTQGHTGPAAAGKVIESFGHFVIGGNFAVGLIVFAILVVINFMVVTKGAGRIAEVAARFTLDAMPGKQMAIDADLNTGSIDDKEARRRRQEISQEADFYGAMDGASKFVRGDAVAGILIMFICVFGGLAIGMLQHDLSFAAAAGNYVLLTIGDGLVAQIPALVISIAAALIVARVGREDTDVGMQMIEQLARTPRTLGITSAILFILGVIPGMPWLVFLLLASACGFGARWLWLRERGQLQAKAEAAAAPPELPSQEASWDDIVPVDVLGLEVGYRLIPMVDQNADGELLKRIKAIRKKFAQDIGFLPPPVHIRDNLELKPSQYRMLLKGVVIGEGEAFNGMWLAINPGGVTQTVPGTATHDPAFGLPAIWIEGRTRESAQVLGYTVVDCATVVATHVNHLLLSHAGQLMGRAEAQSLIDHIAKLQPKLVEDLVPKLIPLGTLQKVLSNLLDEGVHIRDIRTIIETLADASTRSTDPVELTAQVRAALRATIAQSLFGNTRELPVIALDPELEKVLSQSLGAANEAPAFEPGLVDLLQRGAAIAAKRQEDVGLNPTLLVPDRLRLPLTRLLRRAAPRLRVLGHAEIPDTSTIRVSTVLGAPA